MAEQTRHQSEWTRESMSEVLRRQRDAFLDELPVPVEARIDRIERAIDLLIRNDLRIADALNTDFGCRPRDMSRFAEAAASVSVLKHARKKIRRWMRPERRSLDFPLGLLGARAWIDYTPKGVVGVISPWNFPVYLTFGPMSGAFAAGNRVMVKPSEHTPATAALVAELIASTFDDTEAAVCTGGPDVGQAFSSLQFDHLLFTGGGEIGRLVMRAAADNLVPVTLELGGKSPVVVSRSADLERAASSVALGKLMNAGQICIAPDYAFVPAESVSEFVSAVTRDVQSMYPEIVDNPEYTSLINDHHYERVRGMVEEAKAAGAVVIEINPAGERLTSVSHRKILPTLVIDPDDDLQVMRDEIFGPVLPIKGFRNIDEVIVYVNGHPRPLCLYYFGKNAKEQDRLLSRTTAGGVTVNEVIAHALIESLPFGGIGASGMGQYRGIDGFRTFSHPKPVFSAPRANMWKMLGLVPPYGKTLQRTVARELRA